MSFITVYKKINKKNKQNEKKINKKKNNGDHDHNPFYKRLNNDCYGMNQ